MQAFAFTGEETVLSEVGHRRVDDLRHVLDGVAAAVLGHAAVAPQAAEARAPPAVGCAGAGGNLPGAAEVPHVEVVLEPDSGGAQVGQAVQPGLVVGDVPLDVAALSRAIVLIRAVILTVGWALADAAMRCHVGPGSE